MEAKYHLVRKVKTFTRIFFFYLVFILTHEVTIKVAHKKLGKLVDQIIEEGGDLITVEELTWQTLDVCILLSRKLTQK